MDIWIGSGPLSARRKQPEPVVPLVYYRPCITDPAFWVTYLA